ncbi:hypothetical protein GCM10009584_22840 [Ornithinimicrobium humiphilum]
MGGGVMGSNRDKGAAAVEFAFVSLLLITLLFGILDGGRLFLIQSALSHAAREGAREMAIHNNRSGAEDVIRNYPGALGAVIMPSVTPSNCTEGNTVVAQAASTVRTLTGFNVPLTGEARMRCGG